MFYFLVIQTFNDGTPTAKALFDYETMDAAKSALFSNMFSSMANASIKSVLCEIIDEKEIVLKHEIWERNPEADEE